MANSTRNTTVKGPLRTLAGDTWSGELVQAMVWLDCFLAGVAVNGNSSYSSSMQAFPKNHRQYERKLRWRHELDSVLGPGDRPCEQSPDGNTQSEEMTIQKLPGDVEISMNSILFFHTSFPARILLR